jgi:hypothetical protein
MDSVFEEFLLVAGKRLASRVTMAVYLADDLCPLRKDRQSLRPSISVKQLLWWQMQNQPAGLCHAGQVGRPKTSPNNNG